MHTTIKTQWRSATFHWMDVAHCTNKWAVLSKHPQCYCWGALMTKTLSLLASSAGSLSLKARAIQWHSQIAPWKHTETGESPAVLPLWGSKGQAPSGQLRMKKADVSRVFADMTDGVASWQELPLPLLQAKHFRSINSFPPLRESLKWWWFRF